LAGAGLGRISEKRPDFGFAGAEIWYNPTADTLQKHTSSPGVGNHLLSQQTNNNSY